jgi:hypothetical protein
MKQTLRAEIVQSGLQFDNLKPQLNSAVTAIAMAVAESRFVLGGDVRGFLKSGVKTFRGKTFQLTPISSIYCTRQLIFCHHICSLCSIEQ